MSFIPHKNVKVQRNIEVEITPVECANIFWNWSSDDQVKFLNELAKLPPNLYKTEMQSLYILDEPELSNEAKELLKDFANTIHFILEKGRE